MEIGIIVQHFVLYCNTRHVHVPTFASQIEYSLLANILKHFSNNVITLERQDNVIDASLQRDDSTR